MSASSPLRMRFETFKLALKILLSIVYGIACLLTILAIALGAFDGRAYETRYVAYVFMSGFVIWMFREWLAARRRLEKAVRRVNKEHGTAFDLKTGLGFRRGVDTTLFDPDRRKILFLQHDGRFQCVRGFEQIDSWQIGWTERTRPDRITGERVTHRDAVRIQFYLKDITMPSITMNIANYETAQDWSQRLSLLLRGAAQASKGGRTG